MKKLSLAALFSALIMFTVSGAVEQQPSKRYTVMFYNLENFFDTINQPDVLDEEFTPEGPKQWNSYKYNAKLSNIEKVLYNISAENKAFPTVIGVSEIENRNVMEDLAALPKLQRANYQIVHYDSPDRRGVDVAFLYRPDQFRYEGSATIPVVVPGLTDFRTRDIVTMWGTIEDEPFYFMVAHWPSRLGGQAASAFKREATAAIMKRAADSVVQLNPATKIVMMGDFNDDPTDASIAEILDAKQKTSDLQPGGLFNPFNQMHRDGLGTLAYRDSWNLFDNIVISESLVNPEPGTLGIYKQPKDRYYGHIYKRPYLLQQSGQYKGYPLRTYVGNDFQGGYSDHFPVFIFIAK